MDNLYNCNKYCEGCQNCDESEIIKKLKYDEKNHLFYLNKDGPLSSKIPLINFYKYENYIKLNPNSIKLSIINKLINNGITKKILLDIYKYNRSSILFKTFNFNIYELTFINNQIRLYKKNLFNKKINFINKIKLKRYNNLIQIIPLIFETIIKLIMVNYNSDIIKQFLINNVKSIYKDYYIYYYNENIEYNDIIIDNANKNINANEHNYDNIFDNGKLNSSNKYYYKKYTLQLYYNLIKMIPNSFITILNLINNNSESIYQKKYLQYFINNIYIYLQICNNNIT